MGERKMGDKEIESELDGDECVIQAVDVKAEMKKEQIEEVQQVAKDAEMLKDMSQEQKEMTQEAGKKLDQTKENVDEAEVAVNMGVDDLATANEHAASVRRKKLIFIALIICICIIIAGIVTVVVFVMK